MSAGVRPRPRLHPNAVRVLREEFGVDVTGRAPRHLDTLTGDRYDRVITLCDRAREACPEFSHHPRRAHWSIADPAIAGATEEATYPAFRHTAAEIDTRIRHLLPAIDRRREESRDHARPLRQHPIPRR
jgi:protein-tyrosine-phosphatase